jgi:hypothetical protein
MTALVLHRHCPDPPDEGAPEGVGIPEPSVAGDLLHGYVAALEEPTLDLGPYVLGISGQGLSCLDPEQAREVLQAHPGPGREAVDPVVLGGMAATQRWISSGRRHV